MPRPQSPSAITLRFLRSLPTLSIAILVFLTRVTPPATTAAAQDAGAQYMTWTKLWRAAAGQLASWQRDAVVAAPDGSLRLDAVSARAGTDPYRPGSYFGGNFYNGGSYFYGEATGPITSAAFPFSQAVASWNAETPAGTWIETLLRVRTGSTWSKWYNLGVWASGTTTVKRHSLKSQADATGRVDVDTLLLGTRAKPSTAGAFQLKVRFFSADRRALPALRNAAVVVSTTPARPAALAPGQKSRWGQQLEVPECSQMVYRDGGEVWCSPTATSMVLAYWEKSNGPCEEGVRAAVSGTYDRLYDGHGNWPFNAAYAATRGMEAYVSRFTSFAPAEPWIAAGVPVIISFGWGRGQLAGAAVPSSNGHLAVLSGFDASGNPVVNDPAASRDDAVRRTYSRSELERLWLQSSGGTVYLVYPPGLKVPAP
jgi:hypothetical protein